MDESDRTKPETPPPAPSYRSVMGRALLSAGIFGGLGGLLGAWLGKRGNAPRHGMAQSIMKWGLGIFSAILAAYSSLKASEHEAHAQQHGEQTSEPELPNADVTIASPQNEQKIPLSSIQVAGLEPQKLVETQAAQRG